MYLKIKFLFFYYKFQTHRFDSCMQVIIMCPSCIEIHAEIHLHAGVMNNEKVISAVTYQILLNERENTPNVFLTYNNKDVI